jgi:hypothetical protein
MGYQSGVSRIGFDRGLRWDRYFLSLAFLSGLLLFVPCLV